MGYIKCNLPTPSEAQAIKCNDNALRDKYFMANYDFIKTVCVSYCRSNYLERVLAVEMLDECYLYFHSFKFLSSMTFTRSIKDICVYVRFGGERVYYQFRQGNTEILTILDEPVNRGHKNGGVAETLGEILPASGNIYDEIEPDPDITDIVFDYICKFLSPRQREAYKYFYYTDLTAREVGQYMGININGAQSLKNAAIYKLRKHKDEIRAFMEMLGYKIAI